MSEQIECVPIPPCSCGASAIHLWTPGWKYHKICCTRCDLETDLVDGDQDALNAWKALAAADTMKGDEG